MLSIIPKTVTEDKNEINPDSGFSEDEVGLDSFVKSEEFDEMGVENVDEVVRAFE